MTNVGQQYDNYRTFIGIIDFVLGLVVGADFVFAILRRFPIVIGLTIIVFGVIYLMRADWQYWSFKETSNLYITYAPFVIAFGLTIVIFGLTHEP